MCWNSHHYSRHHSITGCHHEIEKRKSQGSLHSYSVHCNSATMRLQIFLIPVLQGRSCFHLEIFLSRCWCAKLWKMLKYLKWLFRTQSNFRSSWGGNTTTGGTLVVEKKLNRLKYIDTQSISITCQLKYLSQTHLNFKWKGNIAYSPGFSFCATMRFTSVVHNIMSTIMVTCLTRFNGHNTRFLISGFFKYFYFITVIYYNM